MALKYGKYYNRGGFVGLFREKLSIDSFGNPSDSPYFDQQAIREIWFNPRLIYEEKVFLFIEF